MFPGQNGALEPGKRLINWVWYCNYPPNSDDYKDLMTDTEGHIHHFTMPVGKIKPPLWIKQKSHATNVLPPTFAELVNTTTYPFVQAITDVISGKLEFMGGKVLLVGDAVAGFRPHTAASTSQAAYHALLLDGNLRGLLEREEMLNDMDAYSKGVARAGIRMGNRSQFQSLR